jgi:hypothetical protein
MGPIGKGKTTTGSQMAIELVQKARIPFLFIDPKGEFVREGRVVGPFEALGSAVTGIEVGTQALPLDFLPAHSAPTQRIARSAMRLRDTLVMCCKSPGDLQKDLLRAAVQDVINSYAAPVAFCSTATPFRPSAKFRLIFANCPLITFLSPATN